MTILYLADLLFLGLGLLFLGIATLGAWRRFDPVLYLFASGCCNILAILFAIVRRFT